MGCADAAASDGRRGCNVYEVNTWLWNFGSGKPRLGGLTVEETAMRKKTARKDQAKGTDETRRRRRAEFEGDEMKCAMLWKSVPVRTSIYQSCSLYGN